MKSKHPKRQAQLRALCDELGPEDGSDSKIFHQHRSHRRTGPDRKTAALCRQAQDALQLALSGSKHTHLRGAVVVTVTPAPDASRLRVVCSGASAESLEAARGWLRSEVAAAIHRKRAPGLIFEVLP